MPTIFNIVPDDLPENRTKVYTNGVKYIRTEKIEFDEIYIPVDKASKKTNSARQGDEDGKHIADLRYSLGNGVDVNSPPPAVEILRDLIEVNGVWKKYRLLDGHHRHAAICEQTDSYVFDVYEIDPSNADMARISFQLKCNNHSPQKKSSTEDITANGSKLLLAKHFNDIKEELSEDLVSDWVEEVSGVRSGTNKNKEMVTRICNKADVHFPYQNYPDRYAIRWVKQYLSHIKLNEDGGHWWIMKKAPDRSFIRMLKKETGEVQHIILNPEPTSAGDVLKARQDLYDCINKLASDVWNKSGGKKEIEKVFKIDYALPQLRDSEDMTKPIKMDKIDDDTNQTLL